MDTDLKGLRPAELCGLKVRDIDFVRRRLTVSETFSPITAYDDQSRVSVQGPTKTGAGQRTIPLPEWLTKEIAATLAARGRPGLTEPLFVNLHGRAINRDTFRARAVRPALRAAGLPEEFRTYDLRHTHASLLISLGVDVLALSERMGHSDPAVTLRNYGHVYEGTQQAITERLEQERLTAGSRLDATVVDLGAARAQG